MKNQKTDRLEKAQRIAACVAADEAAGVRLMTRIINAIDSIASPDGVKWHLDIAVSKGGKWQASLSMTPPQDTTTAFESLRFNAVNQGTAEDAALLVAEAAAKKILGITVDDELVNDAQAILDAKDGKPN